MNTIAEYDILNDAGYIGSWHIDYTTSKARANGRTARMFGVNADQLYQGVPLHIIDSVYTPSDLEMVRRVRRSLSTQGGRLHMRYNLIDAETQLLQPVHSFATVFVDKFGGLREAQGVLFKQANIVPSAPEDDALTYDDALGGLVKASEAVQALGYPHLQTMLQTIFREVARDAIRHRLELADVRPAHHQSH